MPTSIIADLHTESPSTSDFIVAYEEAIADTSDESLFQGITLCTALITAIDLEQAEDLANYLYRGSLRSVRSLETGQESLWPTDEELTSTGLLFDDWDGLCDFDLEEMSAESGLVWMRSRFCL